MPQHGVVHAGITVLELAGSLRVALEQRTLVNRQTVRAQVHVRHLAGDVAHVGHHGVSHVECHLVGVAVTVREDILRIVLLHQTSRIRLHVLEREHITIALVDIADATVDQSGIVEQRVVLVVDDLLGSVLGNGQQRRRTCTIIIVELLPSTFVKRHTTQHSVGGIPAQTAFLRGSLRQQLGSLLQVTDTLVDDLAAVVARAIKLAIVYVQRLGQYLCIAVYLYQFEVQVGTEPVGLTHRGSDAGLIAKRGSVLQQQVGIVDALIQRGEVAVLLRDGIRALTIGVHRAGADEVGAIVRVYTI